jgi:hypothetical protein
LLVAKLCLELISSAPEKNNNRNVIQRVLNKMKHSERKLYKIRMKRNLKFTKSKDFPCCLDKGKNFIIKVNSCFNSR